ncbi:MAG: VOC family protein [Chloroflexi bacterium]|nr:VOC family protein [Chloroflexota bacterium]MBI5714324.1 VOC family protein [Chloroflexota bacterium]
MSINIVTHIEWQSKDYARLAKFMTDVFGFKFDPFGEGYMFYTPGGDGVSIGISQDTDGATAGGSPSVYISVKSIDETLAMAQKLGGTVAVPKTVIAGDMGAFAFVKAPEGNLIGLHEEHAH